MTSEVSTLRRTSLHERHRAEGAKLVPFAGWEMPLQYAGIRPEHLAVRRDAGVFDVSHMGRIETRGPDAQALLQRVLSNALRRLPEGGAQYSVICNERGGVLDDVFTYRLAECHFLTVTNAANHERDLDWFGGHAGGFDVDVCDRRDELAMLAVQGPRARALLG
ncbi:MAG: glycine cleavage system protein T, partial [Trebonia sp.]